MWPKAPVSCDILLAWVAFGETWVQPFPCFNARWSYRSAALKLSSLLTPTCLIKYDVAALIALYGPIYRYLCCLFKIVQIVACPQRELLWQGGLQLLQLQFRVLRHAGTKALPVRSHWPRPINIWVIVTVCRWALPLASCTTAGWMSTLCTWTVRATGPITEATRWPWSTCLNTTGSKHTPIRWALLLSEQVFDIIFFPPKS